MLKLATFLLTIGNLAFPTPLRLGFLWTYMVLVVLEMILLGISLIRSKKFYQVHYGNLNLLFHYSETTPISLRRSQDR